MPSLLFSVIEIVMIFMVRTEAPGVIVPDDDDETDNNEYTGLLKILPPTSNPQKPNINDTTAVYIILKGSTLQVYYTNQQIQNKELSDEGRLQLTFHKVQIFDLYECQVKLVSEKTNRIKKWYYKSPIVITLVEGAKIQETNLPIDSHQQSDEISSLVLFARSDRDKEVWTRRFINACKRRRIIDIPAHDPILYVDVIKPNKQLNYVRKRTQGTWMDSLLEPILTDARAKELIVNLIFARVQAVVSSLTCCESFENLIGRKINLSLCEINLDNIGILKVEGVAATYEDDYGLWQEVYIRYEGELRTVVAITLGPSTAENSTSWIAYLLPNNLDWVQIYADVSLNLATGGLALNVPQPPIDTAWIGFRDGSKIAVSSTLYWGTWRLPEIITSRIAPYIENSILEFFHRNLLIPNMIPVPLPKKHKNHRRKSES